MIFDQKKDGSCEIIFSQEEIEIIKKHKKLHLTTDFLKHFSNTLVKIAIEFNENFDEKTKNLCTKENTKIISNKPPEN
tara:strand:+ start:3114 stop:3347 length:234 start_codon:yes stop_codon:yes gene_type:complete